MQLRQRHRISLMTALHCGEASALPLVNHNFRRPPLAVHGGVAAQMWFVWAWSLSRRAPRSLGIGLYCCAWFVLGFVSCSWVSGAHLGE